MKTIDLLHRPEFMFAELHRELRVLDESSIRKDFLQSEEWLHLVGRAVARSIQVRDSERLRGIARILAGTATGSLPSISHAEHLIEAA